MLLQILRPLERLSAKVTLVRLQRHMDADVGGDVVALDRGRPAIPPTTSQVQVIRTLAANMTLADMLLGIPRKSVHVGTSLTSAVMPMAQSYIKLLCAGGAIPTACPLALQRVGPIRGGRYCACYRHRLHWLSDPVRRHLLRRDMICRRHAHGGRTAKISRPSGDNLTRYR